MSEQFWSPEDQIVRSNAELGVMGCVLAGGAEVIQSQIAFEPSLHEKLAEAFDLMAPEERDAHIRYFQELSEYYQGPGGP